MSVTRRIPVSRGGSWTIALVLAAVLLWYSLQGIDWGGVVRAAVGAEPGRLVVCMALITLSLFLRAERWRLLLNAEGSVAMPQAFWATAAGYFANNFLPARAGELVRVYMISSRVTPDRTYVLATVLADRAADAIVLVIISALVMLTLPAQPGWLATGVKSGAVIAMVGALGIAVLPFFGSVPETVVGRLPLSHVWRERVARGIASALRGVKSFHDVRRVSGFLGLTALIWCLDAAGSILAAQALGFQMTIAAAILLIAGLGLGSALPSTPGYVGIYQFVAVTVLEPFGFDRTDAITYILVAQALSYIVIAGWGGLGLWRFRRARASQETALRGNDG